MQGFLSWLFFRHLYVLRWKISNIRTEMNLGLIEPVAQGSEQVVYSDDSEGPWTWTKNNDYVFILLISHWNGALAFLKKKAKSHVGIIPPVTLSPIETISMFVSVYDYFKYLDISMLATTSKIQFWLASSLLWSGNPSIKKPTWFHVTLASLKYFFFFFFW